MEPSPTDSAPPSQPIPTPVSIGGAPSPAGARSSRRVALLGGLFFASGLAGLVYQVVWLRMLVRILGVTVFAVTTVVAVFMLGLAGGSFAVSRLLRGRRSRLFELYGATEIVVALCAFGTTKLIGRLPDFYGGIAAGMPSAGVALMAVRVLFAAVALLPPTLLMGATLPMLAGHLGADDGAVGKHTGLLYGLNTLGAVVGVLATGFVFIASFGEIATVLGASALNLVVGLVALVIARARRASAPLPASAEPTEAPAAPQPDPPSARLVLAAAAVSGFSALSFEVLWSRNLNILLGNSVYGFSSMLGAYLVGIAVGSLVAARFVERLRRPVLVLAALCIAIAVASVLSLRVFAAFGAATPGQRYTYALLWRLGDFGRIALAAVVIVMPVTLLSGAIFPVASRLVAPSATSPGEAVGRLYGFNTLGGIAGSLFTGFVAIPVLGTQLAFFLASTVSFGLGVHLLRASARCETVSGVAGAAPARKAPSLRLVGLCSGLAFATSLLVSFDDPFLTVLAARLGKGSELMEHLEDRGATVTMFQKRDASRTRILYIDGLYVSNTFPGVGEVMLNLPLAFHPGAGEKSVAVVGMGVGEAFRYGLDVGHRVTVAELHPSVVDLFRRTNADSDKYLGNPRGRIEIDDGRNFLLRSRERFDLILVDGSPPLYASGMANLYSREFLRLAKSRLTPDGLLAVWFPVVCFERDLWTLMHNFTETFGSYQLYSPPGESNALLLGSSSSTDAFRLSVATFAERLKRYERAAPDAGQLRAGFPFKQRELRERAERYPLMTDDRPTTEFPLQGFLRGDPYYGDNRFLYPEPAP